MSMRFLRIDPINTDNFYCGDPFEIDPYLMFIRTRPKWMHSPFKISQNWKGHPVHELIGL